MLNPSFVNIPFFTNKNSNNRSELSVCFTYSMSNLIDLSSTIIALLIACLFNNLNYEYQLHLSLCFIQTLQCTPYDGKPKSDNQFLLIINIFSLQNLEVSEKTFFGFKDGNKKTGQFSVDDSFFSRIFINSYSWENFI